MNPVGIGCVVGSGFVAMGAALFFLAKPLAHAIVWWESLWTERLGMQWLSPFMLNERTSLTIFRIVGVCLLIFGVSAPMFAVILSWAR